MADIFFSYKREDREKVRPLVEALQTKGWSVWWDTRIGSGETWDRVIEAQLAVAKCVVVVWSKRSINSDPVRGEANEGRERRCLIPVTIEGVTPPLIFRMMQATDLTRWHGNPDDPDFLHVCEGIERVAGPGLPPAPSINLSDDAVRCRCGKPWRSRTSYGSRRRLSYPAPLSNPAWSSRSLESRDLPRK